MQRANEVGEETNRAVRAALNAELRCVNRRLPSLVYPLQMAGLRNYANLSAHHCHSGL